MCFLRMIFDQIRRQPFRLGVHDTGFPWLPLLSSLASLGTGWESHGENRVKGPATLVLIEVRKEC